MDDPSKWVYTAGENYSAVRHESERVKDGFSTYDWWNFCDYMAWVNINALEKFKVGNSFPGDLNSHDEWAVELDIMIDGFKAHLAMQNSWEQDLQAERQATYDKGMAFYAKRFASLWD